MRIVSLLPAATEICFELGLGDDVVGVSPECDFPPGARGKPIVSRHLLDHTGKSSLMTSRAVGERLAAGEALYLLDEEALRRAAPDLILTQGLCDVCAPSLGDVRDVAERLPEPPEILSLDPHTLGDVFGDILRVGEACRVKGRANACRKELEARVDEVAKTASGIAAPPRVLCLEWLDPLFVAGQWVPEMVDLAGGEDVLGRASEPSRRVAWRDLVMAAPEVAVLMPCGFHMGRTLKETRGIASSPFWRDLPAARRDRVWVVDGSSYFSRPGPRLVDGLETLAHILHPRLFPNAPSPRDAQRWAG